MWVTVLTLFSSVAQSCFFATPWTAARQASSLSITNSRRLPKLMSIESVMPSNHLISVVPFSSNLQSFPASGSFIVTQFFASGGQHVGVSASTSVLPVNTDFNEGLISFRMNWVDLLAVQELSKVFSNTTVQKHQFFGAQLSSQSNSHIHT